MTCSTLPDTVAAALAQAQAQGLARLDAQMLVLHALGRQVDDRAWLLAHDNDALTAEAASALQTLVRRRLDNEPVAYLTGRKEFFGLDLQVDGRVLVPRPDTETLVQWTLDVLDGMDQASVLDLGTGSGAIALAIKSSRPDVEVHARDFSHDALQVAQANAARLGLNVQFSQGSWFENLHTRYTVVVSNPPYIAEHDDHLPALRHEPQQALTSGPDGLDDIRLIIANAGQYLLAGGWLLLEHGYNQSAAVCALLTAAGFEQAQSRTDLAGTLRCSGARWPSGSTHELHTEDLSLRGISSTT
ncbi:MAG: peptide chain release factor N(5)-glutamine methyltransferase [Pseudomonas fluorescens]|nr:peptide chain release factor N(5)-glutamine methyltransferase [Pseudomonas fluorescens]